MDISVMRQLAEIVRSGSLTAAAERLGVSQPALSAAVKRLERRAGAALFAREKNRLIPTDAARRLAVLASEAADAADRFEAELEKLGESSRALRVGFCDPGPLWFLVPQLRLSAEAPPIDAELIEEPEDGWTEKALELASLRHDVLIVSEPLPELESWCSSLLLRDRYYVSLPAGHRLAASESITIEALAGDPVLWFRASGSYARRTQAYLNAHLAQEQTESLEDYFVFQETLRRTRAVTFTTELVRRYRFDGFERTEILLDAPELEIVYRAAWRADVSEEKRSQIAHFLRMARCLSPLAVQPSQQG